MVGWAGSACEQTNKNCATAPPFMSGVTAATRTFPTWDGKPGICGSGASVTGVTGVSGVGGDTTATGTPAERTAYPASSYASAVKTKLPTGALLHMAE